MRRLAALLISLLLVGTGVAPIHAATEPFTFTVTTVPDHEVTVSIYSQLDLWGHLADGRVLWGAMHPDDGSYRVLLFDPTADSWSWGAVLPGDPYKYNYRLFPLLDGKALYMSLKRDYYVTEPWKAWLYDPDSATFVARSDHPLVPGQYEDPEKWFLARTAIALSAEEIYVFDAKYGYVYNVTTDTWREGPYGRAITGIRASFRPTIGPVAIPMPDGRSVMHAYDEEDVAMWEIFDPSSMTWQRPFRPPPHSHWHGPFGLPVEGRLVTGGSRLNFANTTTSYPTLYSYPDGEVERILPMPEDEPYTSSYLPCTLDILGRDWLCFAWLAQSGGTYDGHWNFAFRDPASGAWYDINRTPGSTFLGNVTPSLNKWAVQLDDGILMLGLDQDAAGETGVIKAQRLTITSGTEPVPPQVVDDLPASLVIPEGDTATFNYHLIGTVPTEGVTVVTERVVGGDGQAIVVEGARELVISRSDVKTVRVAAGIDADGDTSTGTIRVRILLPGGAMDPNARLVTVTIPDRFAQPVGLPGDVNNDGVVNALDLDEVIDHFGTTAAGR